MKKFFLSLALIFVTFLFVAGCQSEKTNATIQPNNEKAIIASVTPTLSPTPTVNPPTSIPTQSSSPTVEAVVTSTPTTKATLIITSPPTTQPTNPATPTDAQVGINCVDEAAFYADVTIPDDTLLDAGTAFTKTWQVRNTGTCEWGEGYSLVFAKGDIMDGPLSNSIPDVAPGEITDISLDLVSPSRGGQQTGYWEFQNSQGSRFGVGSGGHDLIWVQIQVDWSSSGGNQQPTAEPTSESGGGNSQCGATENTSYENQVLSLINSARESAGLPTLSLNSQLSAAAIEHSRDMACVDYVDHTGSDGSTWYDRVAAQGYANYSSARENIYVGDPTFGGTPEGAFTWWMNSQVHRDNILYATVTEIGIGYIYNSNSTYGGYYTVVFARP